MKELEPCESYRPRARCGTPPDTGSSHTGFRCIISRTTPKASAHLEANILSQIRRLLAQTIPKN